MKLSPEAEAEIERLVRDDEFAEWGAEIARAAMVWAYQDAVKSIQYLKYGWGIAEESAVAECVDVIAARAGVKE